MPPISDAMRLAPPGAVRLGGILGDAVEANRRGRLSRFIVDEHSPAIALFAPDEVATNEQGDWYGEHAGKWLIAATRAAVRASDDALLVRVRHVADWLIDRQDADGYLGTYALSRRFMHKQPLRPWSWNGEPALRTWDIWTHAYLILGFVELWRATDDHRYLAAARRIGDLCHRIITTTDVRITELGNHFGLSASVLLDPAVELFLATDEQTYLELALTIVEQLEAEPANRLFSQALAGTDPADIATGKAYQLLWNMVGIAKLYRTTGNQPFLTAALNIWQAVSDHHLSLGGGPWGGVAHRSREVFNAPGSFSPEAYVETCSTMAWIQLNRELLQITGEARFAAEIERAAYNDLLGAQAPNGEDWCYYSFPNGPRIHTTYWRCCKSSGAMGLEEIAPVAYGVTAAGEVAINLLGPSSATLEVPGAGTVRIEQRTDYPASGTITFTVDSDGADIPLLIRIPDWADGTRCDIAGADPVAGSYLRLTASGPVTLTLPMTPKLHVAGGRNVQQSLAPDGAAVAQLVHRTDYVAVTRGPLVYATGLVDGFKPADTVRLGQDSLLGHQLDGILLAPEGRDPIPFAPYWSAGDRQDGAWRLTWLRMAPEQAA